MIKHTLFITGILVLAMTSVKAQFVYDYLKAADNYYKQADYYSATQYYTKYLAVSSSRGRGDYNPYAVAVKDTKKKSTPADNRQTVLYHLAESYRLLNYTARAAENYKAVLNFDNNQFPLARYYYAVCLRMLQQYDEAERIFTHFLEVYTADDNYTAASRKEVANLRFIRAQLAKKDLKLYTVKKEEAPFNTQGASYAPVWTSDNSLLFTSTKPDSSANKNQLFVNRLYKAVYTDSGGVAVTLSDLPSTAGHQGVVSLTPDGNTVFLTRWTTLNGKKSSAIFISHRSNDSWSTPVAADSSVNVPSYNAQQPFVMPDGKTLLFASDRPGGLGGFDLCKVDLDGSGQPAANPINLGGTINTSDDEEAPYYHQPSGKLVFSANGRTGMGGLDFFYSENQNGSWTTPVNFGYPVNSVRDDLYFASRGDAKNILADVLISSDRWADCCLELIHLKKAHTVKHVAVVVIDCRDNTPLPNVKLNVMDTINHVRLYDRVTAADGTYSFTLEEYQPLKIVAAASMYTSDSVHFIAPPDVDEDTATVGICLTHYVPAVGESMVIENVYFEFDNAKLLDSSAASLDNIVSILKENPHMFVEISAYTDNKGKNVYNQQLSLRRAKSVVAYIGSKGIDKDRLWSKGYGASKPLAPNTNPDGSDNPDGRQRNRRVEFKVLKN